MEDFLVSSFVVCFLVSAVLYVVTVVAIRKFMPADWNWYNAPTLDSDIWDKQVPASVRRLYLLFVFCFALGAISLVPLVVMKGDVIGIVFGLLVAGGMSYQLILTWCNYRAKS